MSDSNGLSASKKNIRAALILAGIQIVGALLLTLARKQGLIDGETTTRGCMVLIGLGLAVYGNRMPKTLECAPPQSIARAALRHAVSRVGGWALMLGGLAYAGLWAFAPLDVAQVGCIVVVLAAMVVMFGYMAWRICAKRAV
ncbi:hypothetical protein [Asticcacaulis sp. YBE204]|uniref:hypothetical protein n=1 Tax=Asticcacaulis sp. YBE204 TaxID=1282363 RepID=UPI0003C41066|nr:hypothetical protein [Asticcacaulis sp. YBE204]ESQ78193.1 hypothetical protein AEYBE204_15260 [Asticcacaulis sp. YBE204]